MSEYLRAKAAKFGQAMASQAEAATNRGRHMNGPTPDIEPSGYIDEINTMSLEELEDRLPQALAALDAIETELEMLMGLRDTSVIRIAAMMARLTALQQAGSPEGQMR